MRLEYVFKLWTCVLAIFWETQRYSFGDKIRHFEKDKQKDVLPQHNIKITTLNVD